MVDVACAAAQLNGPAPATKPISYRPCPTNKSPTHRWPPYEAPLAPGQIA